MVAESRFINRDEAAELLFNLSRHDYSKFRHKRVMKIWPGQFWGVYRYEENAVDPVILAKIRVMDISMGSNGASCQLLNCRSNQPYTIGHVPTMLAGFDIGVCFPQRVTIERTIKCIDFPDTEQERKIMLGVSTGLLFIHRSDPERGEIDMDLADPWVGLRHKFTDEGAYFRALESYKSKCDA